MKNLFLLKPNLPIAGGGKMSLEERTCFHISLSGVPGCSGVPAAAVWFL